MVGLAKCFLCPDEIFNSHCSLYEEMLTLQLKRDAKYMKYKKMNPFIEGFRNTVHGLPILCLIVIMQLFKQLVTLWSINHANST